MMNERVIIFGTGLFYNKRKHLLPKKAKIVAFLDNNVTIQGKELDGAYIYSPKCIMQLTYDVIVLASISLIEMKMQLLSLGVLEDKIVFWEEYVSSRSHGVLVKYNIKKQSIKNNKKALIVVPVVNYAGGFLTACYVAMLLHNKGYYTVIATPIANTHTIEEVNKYGINVWLCPAIPYIEQVELEWMYDFDFILINSLQNIRCAIKIAVRRQVILWLHEHSRQYKNFFEQYSYQLKIDNFRNITICSVSNLARKNFLKYFPNQEVKIFPFGVPDFYNHEKRISKKIIIANIGSISQLKNQIELIQAIKLLKCSKQKQMECWFIGRDDGVQYKSKLNKLIGDDKKYKICGEYSRFEMQNIFRKIDVVVCTSLEETMSMAIVEGMMNCKVCITNNNTGIAEYIVDGKNGFIYNIGNIDELSDKLSYIIQNFNSLDFIRNNARKTYQNNFSVDKFANNLEKIIVEQKREFF